MLTWPGFFVLKAKDAVAVLGGFGFCQAHVSRAHREGLEEERIHRHKQLFWMMSAVPSVIAKLHNRFFTSEDFV